MKKPGHESREGSMARSLTDSKISYSHEGEISEVSGSKFYIQDNGHINYKVTFINFLFIFMNDNVINNNI